jgi:hypothetical protein
MGLAWNRSRTHTNHKRGSATTSDGHPQVADQEFYADQYFFDHWDAAVPGKPGDDWANPGAQSVPRYEKK